MAEGPTATAPGRGAAPVDEDCEQAYSRSLGDSAGLVAARFRGAVFAVSYHPRRARGGTGRRSGLKIRGRVKPPCGFESRRAHLDQQPAKNALRKSKKSCELVAPSVLKSASGPAAKNAAR